MNSHQLELITSLVDQWCETHDPDTVPHPLPQALVMHIRHTSRIDEKTCDNETLAMIIEKCVGVYIADIKRIRADIDRQLERAYSGLDCISGTHAIMDHNKVKTT